MAEAAQPAAGSGRGAGERDGGLVAGIRRRNRRVVGADGSLGGRSGGGAPLDPEPDIGRGRLDGVATALGHQIVVGPQHRFDGLGPAQALGGDLEVLHADEAPGRHHRGLSDERERGPVVLGDPEVLPSGQPHPVVGGVGVAHLLGGQRGLSVGDGGPLGRGLHGALRLFEEERFGPLELAGMEGSDGRLEQGGLPVVDLEVDVHRLVVGSDGEGVLRSRTVPAGGSSQAGPFRGLDQGLGAGGGGVGLLG